MNSSNENILVDEFGKPLPESNNKKRERQSRFTDEFIREFYGSLGNTQVNFLNEIRKASSIPSKYFSNFRAFLESNKDKYKEFDLDKLSIFDINTRLSKHFNEYDSKRRTLMILISKRYNSLNPAKYDEISFGINNLDISRLDSLISSNQKREEFLKSILSQEEILSLDSRFSVIDKIRKVSDKKDIKELESKYGPVVLKLLRYIDLGRSLKGINSHAASALGELLELDFFSDDEKKQIITDYLPTISLEDLKKLGILSDLEVNKERRKYINSKYNEDENEKIGMSILLKTYAKDYIDKKYSKEQIIEVGEDNLINQLEDKSVVLDTSDFCSGSNISKLIGAFGFQISDAFKQSFDVEVLKDIDRIKNSGPATLEKLKSHLEDLDKGSEVEKRFKGLEKFQTGNILMMSEKAPGFTQIHYIKILNIDDTKKELQLLKIGGVSNKNGDELIDLNLTGKGENISYYDFVQTFEGGIKTLECLDQNDIKTRITDPKYKLKESGFTPYKEDDLSDPEKKERIKALYKKELESRLENAKRELELGGGKKEKNPEVAAQIDDLTQKISTIDTSTPEKLLESINLFNLIKKVDEVDPSGKSLGLKVGLSLETEEGGVYEILKIENGKITLKSSFTREEVIDFQSFYEAFEKNKTKRISKIKNFQEFMNLSDPDDWKNHEFKDGKIIAKGVQDGNEIGDREVEYLVLDKGDEVIRIDSISGDKVTIQYGKRSDTPPSEHGHDDHGHGHDSHGHDDHGGGHGHHDDGPKAAKPEYIGLDKNKYTITLTELKSRIKEKKFRPNWQTGKNIKDVYSEELQHKYKKSLITRYLNRFYSASEVQHGVKAIFHSIEETLKKGSHVHAAKVSGFLGHLLPEELHSELEIHEETEEAENMDKALKGLSKIDSGLAIARIRGWLLNKDTPEYKKEAGLMFMVENYGHLTSKGPLYEFRGKFLWYEAFGGRVNDELFLDIKASEEKEGVPFSEEKLMHMFLKKQCNHHGYKGRRRRSRLYKEFEGKWKAGVEKDFDKGYKDASRKRTAVTMVKGGMDEAEGGTTSNAIGWLKFAVERGGSMEDMSKGYFSLLYSGALYNVEQNTTNLIKKTRDMGSGLIMPALSTKKGDMEIFNQTVLELSKRISEVDHHHFPNMGKEAEEIFNEVKKGKGNEDKRIKKVGEFWEKYKYPLSRALNMVHTDTTDTAKTDKIIYLEKDSNPIFNAYYKKVKEMMPQGKFKPDFIEDGVGQSGGAGLNVYDATKAVVSLEPGGGFRNSKSTSVLWGNLSKDLKSTPEKVKKGMKREDAKRYIMHTLKEFSAGFLEIHAAQDKSILGINAETGIIGSDLNSWGLNLHEQLYNKFSIQEILADKSPADHIFAEVAERILKGENVSKKANSGFSDQFDSVIWGFKGKVNGLTSNNDNETSRRAA